MRGVDRAAGRRRGDGDEQRRRGDAEALLLALEVVAVEAGGVHRRRRARLGDVDDDDGDDEQGHHRAEDHPALAAVVDHAPVGRGQRRRDARGSSSISTKFVSHVGFSNGIAELTLKKPPPFVPSSLIASWRGDRARARTSAQAGQPVASTEPPRVCSDALGDQEQRRRRPRSAAGRRARAREVDVEVAELLARARGEAADEGDEHGDADAGGDEVLDGQAGHLREVRHRRLAAVELPVRVRQERRGRVERDVPRARAEVPRVPRVQRLGAQDQVEQHAERRRSRRARSGRRPSSPGRARGRPASTR